MNATFQRLRPVAAKSVDVVLTGWIWFRVIGITVTLDAQAAELPATFVATLVNAQSQTVMGVETSTAVVAGEQQIITCGDQLPNAVGATGQCQTVALPMFTSDQDATLRVATFTENATLTEIFIIVEGQRAR